MELIEVVKKEEDVFEGTNFIGPVQGFPVFGGQTMAQALQAAQSVVYNGFLVHFISAYFHRPVFKNKDVIYKVEHVKVGKLFIFKRVHAFQEDKVVLVMDVCFMLSGKSKGINYQFANNKLYETKYTELRSWFENSLNLEYKRKEGRTQNIFDEKLFKLFDYILVLLKHFSISIGEACEYKRQVKFEIKEDYGDFSHIASSLTLLSDFFLLESSLLILRDNLVSGTLSFATSAQHTIHIHEIPSHKEKSFIYLVECERICNGVAMCKGLMFDSKNVHLLTATQEVVMHLEEEEC